MGGEAHHSMKSILAAEIEAGRVRTGDIGSPPCAPFGAFFVDRGGVTLRIIMSTGLGWDHVSVSPADLERTPTWDEMNWVKQQFFEDEEAVMQLHTPASDYRNLHPYCLHLWRPQREAIPLPPGIMVAPRRKAR